MEFLCGKAEDVLPDILERKLSDAESLVAVVDPPRAGLHKKVLHVSLLLLFLLLFLLHLLVDLPLLLFSGYSQMLRDQAFHLRLMQS